MGRVGVSLKYCQLLIIKLLIRVICLWTCGMSILIRKDGHLGSIFERKAQILIFFYKILELDPLLFEELICI